MAGGCFWGLELSYRNHWKSSICPDIFTQVGYIKDILDDPDNKIPPTYYNLDISHYAEGLMLEYDPDQHDVEDILKIYQDHQISDPSPESNPRYRRGFWCHNEAVREYFKIHQKGFVGEECCFFKAEEYHQGYYKKRGY